MDRRAAPERDGRVCRDLDGGGGNRAATQRDIRRVDEFLRPDAEARERSAQAEAEATRMVSEAIAAGDVQAINYFVAQGYTNALKDVAASPNSKTVMIPLEASALIGSVGGIADIAKAVGVGKES